MRPDGIRIQVWDAPTRLFHWLTVLLVFACWLTAQEGWIAWHFRAGYAVFALVLFRLGWGLIGSDTARFSRFLRSPLTALKHLAHFHHREPDTEIGHNPAGGWMVIALLLVLAAMVATGLYANDQALNQGPLAYLVTEDTSDWLTHLHVVAFTILEIAIVLHIAAVAAYAAVKRHNLVAPMITGTKRLRPTSSPPRMASPILAAAVLAGAVAIVAFVVAYLGTT